MLGNLSLLPASSAEAAPPWTVSRWFQERGLGASAPTLEALRGRVVALHAFQMLCPGCVQHGIPQAQRLAASFSSRDVAVVGLHSVFEHHDVMGPDALAAFLHEYRVRFPVAVDAPSPDGTIPQTMRAFGMRGTPTLVLIDRAGRVRLHTFGRPDDMAVGAAVATLVAEPFEARVDATCTPEGCLV